MGVHKSTLVARGTNTLLDPSCVSAPLIILISYGPCRRIASDSLYVGMLSVWSTDKTACRMCDQ